MTYFVQSTLYWYRQYFVKNGKKSSYILELELYSTLTDIIRYLPTLLLILILI